MLLSEILIAMEIPFEVVGEKSFDTLALAGANISHDFCTFVEDEKYINGISSAATMVITKKEISAEVLKLGKGVCIVDNPRIVYFMLHNYLYNNEDYVEKSYDTVVGENCNISDLAYIAEKNVTIGKNVTIEEFVAIKENVTIGDNSIIRAGSVIGGVGFEFKPNGEEIIPVKHLGKVRIEKNVEVQQSVCIDKAVYPWDETVLDEHTKIDNLVHIAHGVKVGKRCMIVANSGIGGRVVVGDDCWIGFGTTIRNGLVIGKNARINMGAVVSKDVDANEHVSGNFAIEHSKFIEHIKFISK